MICRRIEIPQHQLGIMNRVSTGGACPTCADGVCQVPSGSALQPPLLYNPDGRALHVGGLLRGATVFLVCGGPSFKKVNHALLQQPGIITAGLNNSARTFRPQFWFSVDGPDHFIQSVWRDPKITKIIPDDLLDHRIFNGDEWKYLPLHVRDCPAIWTYKRYLGFSAEKFLAGDSVNWGNDSNKGGARSVMLPALRILQHLGARRVVLVGCDFKMAENYAYHFAQKRNAGAASGNNYTYRVLNERFAELRPIFESVGYEVINANPESGLKAFKTMTLDQAVSLALAEFGNINTSNERTEGLYDSFKPPRIDKVVFRAPHFPGDQVAMTGAIRAIHEAWPGLVEIDVDGAEELLSHSPHVRKIDRTLHGLKICYASGCPDFRHHKKSGKHIIQALADALAEKIGTGVSPIDPIKLRGDIRLSDEEKAMPLALAELAEMPFWIIAAGCKKNVPVKGWGTANYQAVVDAFRGRIRFVQVGSAKDVHPPLVGVLNLVGKTDTRELLRLVYHSSGTLSPITYLMHLGAAVEVKPGGKFPRPGIVIAGGREPSSFTAYEGQIAFNNVGSMPCCKEPCGCSCFNETGQCLHPVKQPAGGLDIPRCMANIKPSEVIKAIESLVSVPRVIDHARALLRRIPSGPIKGAEIGVHRGELASQLLRGHFELSHIMADRWTAAEAGSLCWNTSPEFYGRPQGFWDNNLKIALQVTEFARNRRTVIRADSVEAAKQVADGSLDFAFIDADHTYEGVVRDIAAWHPKVKPGGLLCGHDYGRPHHSTAGVKPAADEFAARHGLTLETDIGWTWFIRLPRPFSGVYAEASQTAGNTAPGA